MKERLDPIIKCAFHELRAPGKLKPHPKNLNTHPEEQILSLMQVLPTTGFRRPLTVSKRSGFLIRGHARRIAAMRLGIVRVPVDLQEYESEEQELRDLMADATIRSGSELSGRSVREALEQISKERHVLTGMNTATVAAILSDFIPKEKKTAARKTLLLKVQEIKAADRDQAAAIIREVVAEYGYIVSVF